VDDIVREAGAAKGTFYLYFSTRDEIVTAVAERIVERVGESMAAALRDTRLAPVDRIRGIASAMALVTQEDVDAELVREIHRPENKAVHDALGERIIERLTPAVADTIREGSARGDFAPQDPGYAAAFVLASHAALNVLVHDADELEPVSRELTAFVLRGLGWAGDR
jgi:AcrR family transcriptional regulator